MSFSAVSAQSLNKPVAPQPDTVVTKALKPGKITIVNGDTMNTARNIVQNVAHAKKYSTLSAAIRAANLIQTLNSTGPITIFAPDDAAFNKLKPGMLDTLLKPAHNQDLIALVTYHAIQGKVSAKELAKRIHAGKGQASILTIAGSKLIASIDENRNIVLTDESGGKSIISQFDVVQSNGMLHAVNAVLVPKSKVI